MDERPSLFADRLSALPQRFNERLRPRRVVPFLKGTLKWLGLSAVFVSATAGGLVLHLNTGESRRVTQHAVNALLAPVLRGRIELGPIDELSLVHAHVAEARFYDPDGEEVIAARGIDGRIDTLRLLRDLFAGSGPITLHFPRARVEHADVTLRPDADLIPTLAWTFFPRSTAAPSSAPSRPIVIDLPAIEIGDAHVEGDVGVPISGDVNRVGAAVYVRTDQTVTVDVRETGIALRKVVPGELSGSASYHLDVDLRSVELRQAELGREAQDPIRMHADLGGSLIAPDAPELTPVPVSATAELEGLHLVGKVDLPAIDPAALRKHFPWMPIYAPVSSTRIWVDGELPALGFSANAEIVQAGEPAPVELSGSLEIARGLRLLLDIGTRGLDTRVIVPEAPAFAVDGRARIRVALDQGADTPRVGLELATQRALGYGTALPPIDGVLDVVDGKLIGSVTLLEEGLPVDGRFTVDGGRVSFSAIGGADELAAVPRLAAVGRGGVRARVDGDLLDGVVKAKIVGSAWAATFGLGADAPGFDRAAVEAEVSGPVDKLELTGTVNAHGARAMGERVDDLLLRAKGPLLSPHVSVALTDKVRGDATVSGDVSIPERSAANVAFDLKREGETAKGTLSRVSVGSGGFQVEGLAIKEGSVGNISGSLRVDRGELLGALRGENVDLSRLRRLLALPGPFEGLANVDVHVERSARGRKGAIELELEGGHFGAVDGVSARVSAKLEGDRVEGSGFVRLVDEATAAQREEAKGNRDLLLCDGPIAELRFSDVSGTLKGPLLSVGTWKAAVGSADLAADNLDLGCLARRFPEPFSGVDSVRGLLSARATVQRESGDPFPSISDGSLATRGLELVGKRRGWASKALDLALTLSASGRTGEVEGNLTVVDETVLARVALKTTLSWGHLFASAEARNTELVGAPIALRLTVPSRSFDSLRSLPEPLASKLPALDGEASLLLELNGVLKSPSVYLSAQGFGVAARAANSGGKQWMPPLNLDLTGSYEPSTGRAIGGLSMAVDRAPAATISAAVDLPVEALPTLFNDTPVPWKADATADFYDLPLHAIPEIADREIAGALSGRISFLGINERPHAKVELVIPSLRVQDSYLKATMKGEVDAIDDKAPESSQARLQVELEDQSEGRLQVLGYAGVTFADRVVPQPDWNSSGGLIVGAKDFEISAFYPFVAGVLTKLDGTLNGGLHLEWGELEQAAKGRVKSADLSLSDVVAYIPQFGQELHDGHATIRAEPPRADGKQDIQINNVEAQGIAGRVHGYATATLDGLLFDRGVGSLFIDEGQELPVTVEGVPLGKVRGEARFAVAPDPEGIVLDVRIPTARFDLPASSSRDVQPLDDARGVHISPELTPASDVRDPNALRYKLNVAIDDVEVKSTQLNLHLKSSEVAPIALVLSDRLHAQGDVLLKDGSIVLNKKKFEIDEGLVRLRDEETGNPYVNLTAHWESTAGSRVFVDYVGLLKPISDDKIRFRSDPPRTQDQIVRLLVFGESDKVDGESASATNLAGSVIGGNVATSLANDLIASAFGGVLRDVLALNVGTTETGGGYLGAKIDIAQFSFGGSVEQAEQATTTSSTARAGGCGDFFFDYKISTHWSLRGSGAYCDFGGQTVGASSSNQDGISLGLDVLWQYRY